jgi:hypothetical protein
VCQAQTSGQDAFDDYFDEVLRKITLGAFQMTIAQSILSFRQ